LLGDRRSEDLCIDVFKPMPHGLDVSDCLGVDAFLCAQGQLAGWEFVHGSAKSIEHYNECGHLCHYRQHF